jgi:hypothetical protein
MGLPILIRFPRLGSPTLRKHPPRHIELLSADVVKQLSNRASVGNKAIRQIGLAETRKQVQRDHAHAIPVFEKSFEGSVRCHGKHVHTASLPGNQEFSTAEDADGCVEGTQLRDKTPAEHTCGAGNENVHGISPTSGGDGWFLVRDTAYLTVNDCSLCRARSSPSLLAVLPHTGNMAKISP